MEEERYLETNGNDDEFHKLGNLLVILMERKKCAEIFY